MKKTLLTFSTFLIAAALSAQVCFPDPQYADEPFGIWPTPEEGFEVGTEGELYIQVVNFKIPTDPGEIPGAPSLGNIDSVQVVGMVGLPDGLTWQCESHSGAPCTFYPETPGCAVISGIPTESGIFDLTIQILGYIDLLGTSGVPFEFDEFQIEIQAATSVAGLEKYGFQLEQNMPNPFADETVIEFTLNQPQMVEFNIFNLLGKNVHSRAITASNGVNRVELRASEMNMSPGIYLYSMSIDGISVTRKMVVR